MKRSVLTAGILALAIGGASSAALAQAPAGPGPGYGPGMEYGPGYGRGAMMGGYGWGPGMMGGNYGPGYGRGLGRGEPFAGGGPLALLNLTDEQQQKIAKIQEDNRAKNWNSMGQIRSEQFKLREMYYADKVDPTAVAEQQKKVDELRRQLIKSQVEARNQIDALLTKEQRQQFRSLGPWWQDEAY